VTKDLVNKLLIKDPAQRLGSRDSQEVLEHPFFEGISFTDLKEKRIPSPWSPQVAMPQVLADVAEVQESEISPALIEMIKSSSIKFDF
jgi:serine/threonine protein kinase